MESPLLTDLWGIIEELQGLGIRTLFSVSGAVHKVS